MNIICLEEDAFYELVDRVVARVKEQHKVQDKWVSGEEAMMMLRITSKTTLQKLRDEGAIRYTQPMPKLILYDTTSIEKYLEQHARETF